MSVSNELNETTNKLVERMLRNFPKTRESDRALIVRIWAEAAGGKDSTAKITLFDFLMDFLQPDSKYLSTESVGRARRKLQEQHPELRGSNYVTRQVEEVAAVQEELGYKITPPQS